jgi:thiosulfate/3-mercaptopyruvate sulfurtransferase
MTDSDADGDADVAPDPDADVDGGDGDGDGARRVGGDGSTDPFVTADRLAAALEDAAVTPVDVRDAWEFDGIGHVPGAVNVPFDSFRRGDDDGDGDGDGRGGTLPGATVWRDLMESAGIAPDDTLVAYDDTNGVFAARFLVTALAYGHRDVYLLDGDYSAWTRTHPTTTAPTERDRTSYEVREPAVDPFVDYEWVRGLIDSGAVERGEAVILDTREPEEWAAGHLPGAVQLDWRALVDEDTRGILPAETLREVLAAHGVTEGTDVLLYCNTARRISHTFAVLRHLGIADVAFYEGSLTDWTARGGPVETAEIGDENEDGEEGVGNDDA